jgi:DNA-binding NarL/FixJ family response regulator
VAQWGRIYAEALGLVCQQAFPQAEVRTYINAQEVLADLRRRPVDLLVQTLMLPDMDGVDMLDLVAKEKLAWRVLAVTRRRDERGLLALRNARFDGIVDAMTEHVATLAEVLHLIAAGHDYVSPTFREVLVDRQVPSQLWHQFTPAEIRAFTVIGDGSDDQEAARVLDLCASTVQSLRRNIMHKLHISSSAKLVREAVRLGMVRINDDGQIIRLGFIPGPRPAAPPVTTRTGT